MKDFDFSQYQQLKTPEEWIETALKIPQKKKAPLFFLRPAVIGAAAALVITAAVLLTLRFQFGANPPVAPASVVAPPSVTAVAEDATAAPDSVIATNPEGQTVASESTRQEPETVVVTTPAGETVVVIVPAATRTASPPTTAPAATATVPSGTAAASTRPSGSQPVTQSVPTQPSTAPVTDTVIEPATEVQPATGENPIMDAPDGVYCGTITLQCAANSPFYQDGTVHVRIIPTQEEDQRPYTFPTALQKTDGWGTENAEKTAVIDPLSVGVELASDYYIIEVTDNRGNRKEWYAALSEDSSFIFYL